MLAKWKPATTAKQCGFDPAAVIQDPDGHTVTLRLIVEDALGNLGEDRRVVAIHTDPTLKRAPKQLGASAESPAKLIDLDDDGKLDIVLASSDGAVHALQGATGEELPGFPAHTNTLPVGLTPGFTTGAVPVPARDGDRRRPPPTTSTATASRRSWSRRRRDASTCSARTARGAPASR